MCSGEDEKYEVKELDATRLRRHGGRRRSRNNGWELNPCTREDEAPLVRRAPVTRIGIGIATFVRNFHGAGVIWGTQSGWVAPA